MSENPQSPFGEGETVYATEPVQEQNEETQGDEPKYKNKDWMFNQYKVLKKSTREIAEEIDCAPTTVIRWLDNHDIERRSKSESISLSRNNSQVLRDEQRLRKLYHDEGLSMEKIAQQEGVVEQTVANWLEHHGIETREIGEFSESYYDCPKLSEREFLYREYVEKEKSTVQIAEELETSDSNVWWWLTEHGIDRRNRPEAATRGNLRRYEEQNATRLRTNEVKELVSSDKGIDASWRDIKNRTIGDEHVPYRNKSWLREMYINEGMTITELSELCDCSYSTIFDWLKRFDIATGYE